jgi:hypothetical protein
MISRLFAVAAAFAAVLSASQAFAKADYAGDVIAECAIQSGVATNLKAFVTSVGWDVLGITYTFTPASGASFTFTGASGVDPTDNTVARFSVPPGPYTVAVTTGGTQAYYYQVTAAPCAEGRLTIRKTIINHTNRPTANTNFYVRVICSHAIPKTVTLKNSNSYQGSIAQIAPGSLCTIEEYTPSTPAGCHWVISYPGGKSVIVAGQQGYMLEVQNQLECPPIGSLTIRKIIVNTTGKPTPAGGFSVNVACGHGISKTVVLKSANGYQQSVGNIPAGETCTIEELTPDAPKGCQWVTSYPQGTSAYIAGQAAYLREVRNELLCSPSVSLTVKKTVINTTGKPTGNIGFNVQVTCGHGNPIPFVLTSANGYQQTISQVPAGQICGVTESTPAAPQGCHWLTSYPPGMVTSQGSYMLEVVNRLDCSKR